MTVPTPGQKLAMAHAKLATELASPIEQDRFVSQSMLPVVRAYRALTHALLASWAISAPDICIPDDTDSQEASP